MAGAERRDPGGGTVFVADGRPVHFFMRPCKQRQELRNVIEANGGLLSGNRNAADVELYSVGDICSNRDALPSVYVHECVKAGQLLDAETFRKTYKASGNPDDGDSDGRISDIEDEPARAGTSEAYRRQTRRQYLLSEDLAIIDYVAAHCRRYPVQGSSLWKKMQQLQITPHSWQSMKQRFKMQIMPRIHGYDVPQKTIAALTATRSMPLPSGISSSNSRAMESNRRNAEIDRATRVDGGIRAKELANSRVADDRVQMIPASPHATTCVISEPRAEQHASVGSTSPVGSRERRFRPSLRFQRADAGAGGRASCLQRPTAASHDRFPAPETDRVTTSAEHVTTVSLAAECRASTSAGKQSACVHGTASANRKRKLHTVVLSSDHLPSSTSSTSSEDDFDRILIAASSRAATDTAPGCGPEGELRHARVPRNNEPLADSPMSKVDVVEQSQESNTTDGQCQVARDLRDVEPSQGSDATDSVRQTEHASPPVQGSLASDATNSSRQPVPDCHHDGDTVNQLDSRTVADCDSSNRKPVDDDDCGDAQPLQDSGDVILGSHEVHTVDDAERAPLVDADTEESRILLAEDAVERLIKLVAGDLKCSPLTVVRILYACNCDFKAAVRHLRSGSKGIFTYQDDKNVRMGRYDLLKGKHSKQDLIKRMEFLHRWDNS